MNREIVRQGLLYCDTYSTSLLGGTEHAFSFNFLLCRDLLLTVNIPVQEGAVCRIIVSVWILMC